MISARVVRCGSVWWRSWSPAQVSRSHFTGAAGGGGGDTVQGRDLAGTKVRRRYQGLSLELKCSLTDVPLCAEND